MADTRAQEQSRGITTRRQENLPSREFARDIFNPFSMLRRLSEEMDRTFGSSFGLGRAFGESGTWLPPIEVRERDNNLEILAELPGMNKEDVNVEVRPEGVVIEGEKKREKEVEEAGVHTTERSYGHFVRVVPLPEGAEGEKAKAEFKNGVLQIRVPYSEEHRKSRRIPIG
jgi:HSP20 family protein